MAFPDIVPQLKAAMSELRGRLPAEGRHYGFDRGLLITATDARRYRVDVATLRAAPYEPPKPTQPKSQTEYDQAMGAYWAMTNGLVGTSRETVSRAMSELQRRGYIRQQGRGLLLLGGEELEEEVLG